MKLTVVLPSVIYREGPQAVVRFVQGVEQIGYHHLDVLDRVTAGLQTAGESRVKKPSLDALTTLGFAAGATRTIGLGARSVVLPQRETMLVAEQVGTLDQLSGGRMRLGIGFGGPAAEYEALGKRYEYRGQSMDQAVALLRSHWQGETLDLSGAYFRADRLNTAPSAGSIPIWLEGAEPEVLKRTGCYCDGWSGHQARNRAAVGRTVDLIRQYAVDVGRDPAQLNLQMPLAPFGCETESGFFCDHQRLAERVSELEELGLNWASIDAAAAYQGDSPTVDRLVHCLDKLFQTLQPCL